MCSEDDLFIDKLKAGNEEAFRVLIDEYKQKVLITAVSFVPYFQDAEDIAQEVFIEVFKSIRYFRNESSLSTWIYRITVNKSLNYLKKNKKYLQNRSFDEIYSTEIENNIFNLGESRFQQKELKKILYKALSKLPKRQKIVFILHKVEGKSYKTISVLMSVSIATVEGLMHRAKNNLKNLLREYYERNIR